MKLHLGCGQRYFDGYINIDYPLSEHSVQTISVADRHANLLELNYEIATINEVRLHHVFEHFSRPCALALLASWNSWLVKDGILCIEVPDFEASAKKYLSAFSSNRQKSIALRHIFGSQEAHWAVHFEGYSKKMFKKLLPLFGFEIINFSFNNWKGTYNIVVKAKKINLITKVNSAKMAKDYLSTFLVSDTESEIILLEKWMDDFNEQISKSYSE
jgi:hypothetical protein